MIALSVDPVVRQIVAEQDPERWRVDIADEAAGVFSVLTHETRILLVDEAATSQSYIALLRRARKTNPALESFVIGGPK